MSLAINPEVEFPDAETLIVDYLDGLLDEPVRTFVPNQRPAAFVVLQRTGGIRANAIIDAPHITFDTYASTETAASELARQVRRHITQLPGQVLAGVTAYGVDEIGGPANFPDPRSQQARYTQTHLIRLRGASPATGS